MLPRSLQPAMVKLRKLFFTDGARLSHHDVAAKLHMDPRNAREYLNEIRGELRIVEWVHVGTRGLQTPVYAAGPGDDEPRPEAIKAVEHQRRRRQRAEIREAEAKQKRVARLAENFKAGEHLPMDALMAAVHRDGSIGRL